MAPFIPHLLGGLLALVGTVGVIHGIAAIVIRLRDRAQPVRRPHYHEWRDF